MEDRAIQTVEFIVRKTFTKYLQKWKYVRIRNTYQTILMKALEGRYYAVAVRGTHKQQT